MKARHKSKTHWVGGVTTALGVIVQNAEVLQPLFGAYGGAVFAVLGVTMMVLRELTKEPVGKPDPKVIN